MASGDSLLILPAMHALFPVTSYGQRALIGGTSSPNEQVPVVAFDDTSQEYIDFLGVIPNHYNGGGLTVTLVWACVDVASDVVEWQVAFRRIEDDAEDLDTTAHTYDYNAVVATAPSASGEVAYDDITFTSGADMDSLAAGEAFLMRVTRDPTPSSGTDATGDALLVAIHISET